MTAQRPDSEIDAKLNTILTMVSALGENMTETNKALVERVNQMTIRIDRMKIELGRQLRAYSR